MASTKQEDEPMEVETVPPSTENQGETMETSEATKSVMAPSTVGSVTCSLHPLVIMNVSEHWTREKAQEGLVQQGKGTLGYVSM